MADTKISGATAVTTPASTDEYATHQGGASKRTTRVQMHTLESGESFTGEDAAGPSIVDEAASGTNPTLIPDKGDLNTGIGQSGAAGDDDELSLIAGGKEMLRLIETGTATTDQIIIGPAGVIGATGTPSLAWGDGDTGLFESSDDVMGWDFGGVQYGVMSSVHFRWGAGAIDSSNASFSVPNLLPQHDDTNTGIGRGESDSVSIVGGGLECQRWTEVSSKVLQAVDASTAITANTNSSQGDTPLTSSYNVISVCANAGDAVTLPATFTATTPSTIVYVKNDGAQSADVFPASGDDAGAGANIAVAIAAGNFAVFIATAASATWTKLMGGTA